MMEYLTNCTISTAEKIDAMVEHEENKELTYEELLEKVSQETLDRVFPWYVGVPNLSLESDYGVSYYKSYYENQPCVYVCHSCIEYIFVDDHCFF